MNFPQILSETLKFEGGQANDSGGKTNAGVTQKTYDAYAAANKLPRKSVNDLSFGEVHDMYKDEFFQKPKFDKLPEKVAGVMFDYGVNSGTGTATKDLQKIVGVKADGIIGKKTLSAMDKYIAKNGEDSLTDAVMTSRENLMTNLVTQDPVKYGAYEQGWSNRTQALRQKYLSPKP